MKILSASQIREADAYTIANEPIESIDLMERASRVFAEWFTEKFSSDKSLAIFAGIGNNGGDGLCISRMLWQSGFDVTVYIVNFSTEKSKDFMINENLLKDFPEINVQRINTKNDLKNLPPFDIIIDALLGVGLNRAVEGLVKNVIDFVNQLKAVKIAVDIPSGLSADINIPSVKFNAHYTFSFEFPKISFLYESNQSVVGEWENRSIGLSKKFVAELNTTFNFLTKEDAAKLLRTRKKFSHKGTNGHSLMVAGSYGKIGAGILAAKACLVAGSGLVTLHLPHVGLNPVHANCPELMLSIDQHEYYVTHIPDEHKYSAIGIGPGLDTHPETQKAVFDLLKNCTQPVVLDADALNILSKNKEWLKHIPENSILTPHPKEFKRLFGDSKDEYERTYKLMELATELQVFIVLKGAYSSIACPDGSCWFNSSGNPALATAGSGDVLTGVITSLLAQGYPPKDSALLGVFLHGFAADLYVDEFHSDRMIASEIIDLISYAISQLSDHR